MVAAQYVYSKGRTFARRVSAAFAVFFGLFAIFFTASPKLWGSGNSNQNISSNFFTQNIAHADITGGGGGSDGGSDGGGGDVSSGSCGMGGVDSVGDAVGGGQGDTSGGCSCADGVA